MRRALAGICTAVALVAGLTADASATRNRAPGGWQLRVLPGPAGGASQMFGVADDGWAVGYVRNAAGARHGVYWNGRRLIDLSRILGPGSEITSINDHHQMVGFTSANPGAVPGDLFRPGVADPARPHAFWLSGRNQIRLARPSFAQAIDASGVVVGDFRAGDGTIHAFAWTPRPKSGARGAGPPRTPIDLGAGQDAHGVSDPVAGGPVIVVGSEVWRFSPITGRFTAQPLPAGVTLLDVSDRNLGVGFQVAAGSNQEQPIDFDVQRNQLRTLGLSQPSVTGLASATMPLPTFTGPPLGFLGGTGITSSGDQRAILATLPGGPLSDFTIPGATPGLQLLSVNHFTAVGLAGGAADLPGHAVVGFLAIPPPALLVSFYNDLVSSVAPPHVKTLHTTSAPGGDVQLTRGCNEVVADLHNSVADLNRRPTDWRLIRTAESTFFVASVFHCTSGHAMFTAP